MESTPRQNIQRTVEFGVPMHTELPNLVNQQDSLDEFEAPDTNVTPLATAQRSRTKSDIIRTQPEDDDDVYIFRWLLSPLSHMQGHTGERLRLWA